MRRVHACRHSPSLQGHGLQGRIRGGTPAPEADLAHPAHRHVRTAVPGVLPLPSTTPTGSGPAAEVATGTLVHAAAPPVTPYEDVARHTLGSLWLCQSTP